VNKMDLVGFDEATFTAIADEFAAYARELGIADVHAVPVSALEGDNVVTRSAHTDWYAGPTLLEHLEQVPVTPQVSDQLRFPVQVVIRPRTPEHPDYRGYAGRVSAGVVRVGDRVTVLPSGASSTVVGIDTFDSPLERAVATQSVTLRLADDVDVARGDIIVPAGPDGSGVASDVEVGADLVGTVCWLAERPSVTGARLLVRIGTRTVRAILREVTHRLDIDDLTVHRLDRVDTVNTVDATDTSTAAAPSGLALNGIGRVRVRLAEPVVLDAYTSHRATGGFLLVDPADGTTLAAGMAGATLLDRLAPDEVDGPGDDAAWLGGAGI